MAGDVHGWFAHWGEVYEERLRYIFIPFQRHVSLFHPSFGIWWQMSSTVKVGRLMIAPRYLKVFGNCSWEMLRTNGSAAEKCSRKGLNLEFRGFKRHTDHRRDVISISITLSFGYDIYKSNGFKWRVILFHVPLIENTIYWRKRMHHILHPSPWLCCTCALLLTMIRCTGTDHREEGPGCLHDLWQGTLKTLVYHGSEKGRVATQFRKCGLECSSRIQAPSWSFSIFLGIKLPSC